MQWPVLHTSPGKPVIRGVSARREREGSLGVCRRQSFYTEIREGNDLEFECASVRRREEGASETQYGIMGP